MSKRFTLSFIAGVFIIIGLLPVLQMFVHSVIVNGHISFVNYKTLLLSGHTWTLLKNSLLVSFLTTTLAVVVSVPLGLLIGKTDLPFKNFFRIIFIIPLLLPPYVTAVAWFDILGREGFLSNAIGLAAAGKISSYLFGLPGCVFVFFTIFMPIIMFLTATYVKTVNTHLEKAARLVAPWKVVIKGMIFTGILLSSILVFLLSLGEFSVPMFLRYDVFPVESFTQFSAFYNYSAGTAFVIPLIAITLLIL